MVSSEVIRSIVVQQKSRIEKSGDFIERTILAEILAAFDDNRVLIITGIRRCGKSTLLKQVMDTRTRFCYVNFEDERFLTFRAEEFEDLNEVLIEVYGAPDIYFFDEVQNIDKFETFVRRLQDSGKKVLITGSNASLLSREFGTRLTGRYRLFELYPFSFAEFLSFRKIRIGKNSPHIPEEKAALKTAFAQYRELGGMPEYLINEDEGYIKTLYDNILYRDIITRYSIRQQRLVRELVGILLSTMSLPFTYNSLKKSLGLSNAITVKEYITYLNSAYLFFELLRFDYSLRKQLSSPRKIYVIDTAFSMLGGFSMAPDSGRYLENIVFIELKRRGKEVFYFSGKRECDFIIKDGPNITGVIQVCHELNDQNREREFLGLSEAMDRFQLDDGLILTNDREDTVIAGDKTVYIKPVWKWLLENELR
ncbi:MAG TPA: ATP-binding protein [Methanoregulaceae archaeon]|nr:ATP-binding protein [Methanoregulaceae archaeon]